MAFIIIGIILVLITYLLIKKKESHTEPDAEGTHVSDGEFKSKRVVKKSWGEFELAGLYHLPEENKNIIWNQLKKGDLIVLTPDLENQHDDYAIKAFYKNIFAGWVPRDYHKKRVLFEALNSGKEVTSYCTKHWDKVGKISVKYEFQKV